MDHAQDSLNNLQHDLQHDLQHHPQHDLQTARRTSSLLRGVILMQGKSPDRDCTVLDLTSDGARLAITDPSSLPARFALHFPLRKETHECVVLWRKSGEVGVRFDRTGEDSNSKLDSISTKLDQILQLLQPQAAHRDVS